MRNKREGGDLGEEFAFRLLIKKGYKIIDRNFHTKFGELDIVAIEPGKTNKTEETLVFVEVKTRWSKRFGLPEEAVTDSKLNKIKNAADIFIKRYPNIPKKQRIDVVAIIVSGRKVVSAKHIQVENI